MTRDLERRLTKLESAVSGDDEPDAAMSGGPGSRAGAAASDVGADVEGSRTAHDEAVAVEGDSPELAAHDRRLVDAYRDRTSPGWRVLTPDTMALIGYAERAGDMASTA